MHIHVVLHKSSKPEVVDVITNFFTDLSEDELSFSTEFMPDCYNLVTSPKIVGLTAKDSNCPLPNGWCLPEMNEVIKGKSLVKFETSIKRIKNHMERKVIPVERGFTAFHITDVLDSLPENTPVTIDLETKGFSPMEKGGKILTVSISYNDGSSDHHFCFPYQHPEFVHKPSDLDRIGEALKSALQNTNIHWSAHNAKYENKWLYAVFGAKTHFYHDTMLYHYLLDENESPSLENLTWRYYPQYAGYEIDTNGVNDYSEIPLSNLMQYNGSDTAITLFLVRDLYPIIKNSPALEVWEEFLQPSIHTLAVMELNGFEVDWEYYYQLQGKLENIAAEHMEIVKSSEEAAILMSNNKQPFNVKSYQQRSKLLFDIAKIKPSDDHKTNSGGYSTNAEAIEHYAKHNPKVKWIDSLRLYNKATGLISTFLKDRPEMASKYIDNRIHTNFNTHIVVTGRLSSTNPNQQNLARDSDLKADDFPSIKKLYPTRFGKKGKIVSADFDQIELRIVSALAADKPFINVFEEKGDPHGLTALDIFGPDWGDVERSKAKTINFSILNDISDKQLAVDLETDQKEASLYIKQFFRSHPDIRYYMDSCHRTVLDDLEITSVFGRTRRFPELRKIKLMKEYQIEHALRQAANFTFQSVASDITLFTINKLVRELQKYKMKSLVIGNVHDSIIIDAINNEVETVEKLLTEITSSFDWPWLNLPLTIDSTSGPNLSEQK